MFWIVLLMAFTFAICWFNAVYAGKVWAESKFMGGWMHLVSWSAAIQSAFGFTMIFAIMVSGALYVAGYHALTELVMRVDYLLIIVPLLGTGLIITIDSWIRAYRDRSILNMGTAAYNTFATVHNTYDAMDGIGDAFGGIIKEVDTDEIGGLLLLIALAVVAVCLTGGILLTRGIIRSYAGSLPLPVAA